MFGAYGDKIGAKLLYNGAGFLQGLSGVLFGLLSFVEDKSTFLACSYLLRYFDRNYWENFSALNFLIESFQKFT